MLEIYQWMEYVRRLHLYSKQEMASTLEVSPRTYSKILNSKLVSKKLTQTLVDKWDFIHIEQDLFESLNKKLTLLHRNILYVDYTKAKVLMEELDAFKEILEHSTLVKTYTLYTFMYLTHAQDMIYDIDYIQHQCEILEPFMTQEERNLYQIVLNGFYYIKGDFKKSYETGLSNIENVTNPHLKALSYFLLGASSVNEVGRIEKSLEYLKTGQKLFEDYANYPRAQRCQAFILVGLVHSRRFDEFFENYALFQEIPVLEEDKTRVFSFIEGTKARYYMLIKAPLKALKILNNLKNGASSNQFFRLIASLQCELWDEVDHILLLEKKHHYMENRYHLQLVEILEHYRYHKDERAYSLKLVKLMNHLEKSHDFISIMLISEVTIQACIKNRLFKDAYQIMQKKLALLV